MVTGNFSPDPVCAASLSDRTQAANSHDAAFGVRRSEEQEAEGRREGISESAATWGGREAPAVQDPREEASSGRGTIPPVRLRRSSPRTPFENRQASCLP